MKRLLPLALIIVLVFAALPFQAAHATPPTSVLDQSFATPTSGSAALDQCCHYVAQTFTAGMTGALTSIRVEINSWASFSLRFAIHGVTNGVPDARIFGEAAIWESTDEPVITSYLDRDIPIYPAVYVVAGQQYAIVANYLSNGPNVDGSGSWWGATGDAYKGGSVFLTNDENFATWETWPGFPDLDLHFQTYVLPNVPVSDLSISIASKPRHAKACETFNMVYRVTNNGPDTAREVSLGIGLWDQFDAIMINGTPVGMPHPTVTLKPGESALMTATIKVTAFVPGEMRKGLVSGHVWSDDQSTIPVDLNASNDGVDYLLPLIGKQVQGCP